MTDHSSTVSSFDEFDPFEDFADMPPAFDDFGPDDLSEPRYERTPKGQRPREVPAATITDCLRRVLASADNKPAKELQALLGQIKASSLVLDELPASVKETYCGVIEALEFEVANLTPTALVSLRDIPVLALHTDEVTQEIEAMAALASANTAALHPAATFQALAEQVQAAHARRKYLDAVATIDANATAAAKMQAHKATIPPTTQVAQIRVTGLRTVASLLAEHEAQSSAKSTIYHSSGFASLDLALTADGEPLHYIAPNEQMVIAGPTGTGKSSMQYGLTRAAALDEINWGLPDAPVLLAHTEEEWRDKARAMGILPGQRFHHLKDKIVIESIGSSRERLTEAVYDMVVNAIQRSQGEGRPITDFLPRIGFLDYIQAVSGAGESNQNVSHDLTAELILRGFQAFNPDEMAKFSGVDFRSYTGMAWPEGIEDHRMGWVVFAQLRKPADEAAMYFAPGSAKTPLSNFAYEDPSDAPSWTDPNGGGWSWEVRERDLKIFGQNDLYGSSKILNNATNIVLLHRSRPRNNPAMRTPGPDDRIHLEDTRARLILDKTRNGSKMKFVPMAFDIQPADALGAGFRAQYYDLLAEKAIETGQFEPDEAFRQSGDPILPRRPKASPFAGVRY